MTNHSTTIWHIDDDELLLALFGFVLEEAGFNVVASSSKAEARRMAATAPQPGLIMLDMDMPAMNGLEALGWLNGLPRLKDVPVIIVSARFAADEQVQAAFEAGASGYISKVHLSLESLPKMVRDYLSAAQQARHKQAHDARVERAKTAYSRQREDFLAGA